MAPLRREGPFLAGSEDRGGDFAAILKARRLEAGMTQAELAGRSSLTAAYISQLESRKKPPPSDEVVRRIAVALGGDPERLLEVAHLDKTPMDVRRKVRLLDARLRRQRRIARGLMDDVLPLTLFNFLRRPASLDRASSGRRVSARGRTVLAQLKEKLAGLTTFKEFRRESREAINGLGEEDRESLVETLTVMADWEKSASSSPPEEEPDDRVREIPVFDRLPPHPFADHVALARGFLPVVSSRWRKSRWALSVSDDSMFPRLEKDDLLVLDEAAVARNGDIVAADDGAGGWVLGRYTKLDDEIEIAPVNPNHPPRRLPRGRKTGWTLRGVGVEVLRTLRPK